MIITTRILWPKMSLARGVACMLECVRVWVTSSAAWCEIRLTLSSKTNARSQLQCFVMPKSDDVNCGNLILTEFARAAFCVTKSAFCVKIIYTYSLHSKHILKNPFTSQLRLSYSSHFYTFADDIECRRRRRWVLPVSSGMTKPDDSQCSISSNLSTSWDW